MAKIDGRAEAFFNGDLFYIRTMSQGMLAYTEPEAEPYYLSPNTTDGELGRAVKLALSTTKIVTPAEFQLIYKSGAVQKVGEERSAWIMAKYGYRTRKAMYRQMMCCWIELADGQIEIAPTIHDSLDGYRGISKDGSEIMRAYSNSPDEELGATLKEGFRRCVAEWP